MFPRILFNIVKTNSPYISALNVNTFDNISNTFILTYTPAKILPLLLLLSLDFTLYFYLTSLFAAPSCSSDTSYAGAVARWAYK